MLYDLIIEAFKEKLPNNFMLSYDNNRDTNWDDILGDVEDKIVHGVMRLDSGTNEYIADQTVRKEDLHWTFAIPNEPKIFKESIEAIQSLVLTLNNYQASVDTDSIYKLMINQRSSGEIYVVNRTEWVMTDLYFQIEIFHDLITSDELEIKINETKLDVGIIDVVYDYSQNCEAKITGIGQTPTNFFAGAQKQLIINCVPQTGATLYTSLLNAEDTETTFAIKYNNGIITREFNARLIGINEHVVSGGTYVSQIKFLRTK